MLWKKKPARVEENRLERGRISKRKSIEFLSSIILPKWKISAPAFSFTCRHFLYNPIIELNDIAALDSWKPIKKLGNQGPRLLMTPTPFFPSLPHLPVPFFAFTTRAVFFSSRLMSFIRAALWSGTTRPIQRERRRKEGKKERKKKEEQPTRYHSRSLAGVSVNSDRFFSSFFFFLFAATRPPTAFPPRLPQISTCPRAS